MNSHEELAPLLAAYELGLLSAEERAKFERHIAECDLCFEDAYEFSPVSRQLRNRAAGTSPRSTSASWRFVRLAVAACLTLFAATGYWIFKETTTVVDDQTRGAKSLELITPQENQLVTLPVTFRWKPNAAASYYVFHLMAADGTEIESSHLETNTYQWTLIAPTSGRYTWSVQACLSDGTVIARSQPHSFLLH